MKNILTAIMITAAFALVSCGGNTATENEAPVAIDSTCVDSCAVDSMVIGNSADTVTIK